MSKVRVFIADKNPTTRFRVRALVELRRDIEVVGEAGTGREALLKAPAVSPDIVLVNVVSVPGAAWMDFIEILAQRTPTIRAVLTIVRDDSEHLGSVLETAAAVMAQPASYDRLTIDIALSRDAGQPGGTRPAKPAVSEEAERAIARRLLLSPREHEVLRLLAEGYSNREVAERIFRSIKTVETYHASIKRKLGVCSRAEIVRYVRAAGLLY